MEALLQSLAMKYGMDKAVQLLGIDKQQANPKYAISLGGQSINPMNMLKRAGLNQGMKGIMSGGKMSSMMGPGLLLGGALGLGYLTNPLRPGSYNYNPNLQGQIDYASGKGYIGTNPNSGLMQYGPESVLSGQNVVSGFGTNDYQKQLQDYIDKMEAKKAKGYNTFFGKKTTDFSKGQQEKLDKALAEKGEFFEKKQTTQEDYRTKLQGGDGGGGNVGGGTNNAQHGSSGMSKSQHSAFRAARGGIASL